VILHTRETVVGPAITGSGREADSGTGGGGGVVVGGSIIAAARLSVTAGAEGAREAVAGTAEYEYNMRQCLRP